MIPIWKNIPFLRYVIPFAGGIICSWYFLSGWETAVILFLLSIPFQILFSIVKHQKKFVYSWMPGISITIICFTFGVLLVWLKLNNHHPQWIGVNYKPGDVVQIRLLEPLTERQKTYKALAEFISVEHNGKTNKAKGNLILYFHKDSIPPPLQYGNTLAINKPLQEIKNAGNPGGFDYKRYALFNGITHQIFLNKNEYVLLKETKQNFFWSNMYKVRDYVLQTLRKNIRGDQETSVAEALLIGYRDDLDRDLVQAYSNTGVVHIIAISGLHLGLIYWLLLILLTPLDKIKRIKWLKPVLAVAFLWIFSLLTGAGASVLRSAVMFSFIAGGELIGRKGNIYNSLAASAFVLLCYNPFFLWDVGFQLSYAAVLSIVLFMKPIYNWVSFENKFLDKAWQLNAVTLSAQILTLPLAMYHFHQSPNLFFITNFVAVPLSSIILFGEILLMSASFIPIISNWTGFALSYLLKWMNQFIIWTDHFSFAVTDGIMHTPLQTITLYLFIAATAIRLLKKERKAAKWSIGFLCLFFCLQSYEIYKTSQQKKLVVYNLSQHRAIDLMIGSDYYFIGDSVLLQDGFLRNFHLKPSRIFYRTYHSPKISPAFQSNIFTIHQKKILLINTNYQYDSTQPKIIADVVIVSKNPKLYISNFIKTIDCKQIIFDSSNPQWKVALWKKDCTRFGINAFSTNEQGAFVMNL